MITYDTHDIDTFTKTMEACIRLNVPFHIDAARVQSPNISLDPPDRKRFYWMFSVTADYDMVTAP